LGEENLKQEFEAGDFEGGQFYCGRRAHLTYSVLYDEAVN